MGTINWYPGHMKKTKDLIVNNLKLIDVVIELRDARIPFSSYNPQFDALIKDKKRIIALTKMDLADGKGLDTWIKHFESNGVRTLPINSNSGENIKLLKQLIKEEGNFVVEKAKRKGLVPRPIRVMIIGIPNVGKSSLINKLAGKKSAKTGNRPGVTKGKQWIRLGADLELFDTPGILWPKIEKDEVGFNLAYTGAIKDEILDIGDLAYKLLGILIERYPTLLEERYDIKIEGETLDVMDAIGKRRGCLMRGAEIDYEKVARIILDEYRKGIIGRTMLELPNEEYMNEA